MNLLAAEYEIHFHEIDIPRWAEAVILVGVLVMAAAAAVIIWRTTRRKGPPPLPRP